MREAAEPTWFAQWETELPCPEDLIPLSQSLISPNLSLLFNLSTPNPNDPARALKKPRLVWTPDLHKRFVDAVAHLGIKNAVPKTIMQLMSVDGLTRENVASHLQKYRLYLKRSAAGPAISAADAAVENHYMQFLSPSVFQRHQRFGFHRMGVMMQPPKATSLPVLSLFPTKNED